MPEGYVNQKTLLDDGWTKGMIDKLLPSPTIRKNPMYAKSAPMKLWSINDVESVKNSKAYSDMLNKVNKRKESAKKAVKTKKNKLQADVSKFLESLYIVRVPLEEVKHKAIIQKERWESDHGNFEYVGDVKTADEATINRWMVNYIRHKLCKYDACFGIMDGKTGKTEIYPEYKRIVLQKIAERYPTLKEECERQEGMIYYE